MSTTTPAAAAVKKKLTIQRPLHVVSLAPPPPPKEEEELDDEVDDDEEQEEDEEQEGEDDAGKGDEEKKRRKHKPPQPIVCKTCGASSKPSMAPLHEWLCHSEEELQLRQQCCTQQLQHQRNIKMLLGLPAKPSGNHVERRLYAIEVIRSAARRLSASASVQPFGSFANGLWNVDSDVDLSVIFNPHQRRDPSTSSSDASRLEDLKSLLALKHRLPSYLSHGIFRGIILIEARVPVLRFLPKPGDFGIDVVAGRGLGVVNSALIADYLSLDHRAFPVISALKLFAKRVGCSGSQVGFMVPYGFVLIGIYFLQHVCSPSVLPNMQNPSATAAAGVASNRVFQVPEGMFGWHKPTDWRSENTMSISELFVRLVRFIGCEFQWEGNAISIRTESGLVVRGDEHREKWGSENPIVVEDPLEHGFNVARTLDTHHFKLTIHQFQTAYLAIINSLTTTTSSSSTTQRVLDVMAKACSILPVNQAVAQHIPDGTPNQKKSRHRQRKRKSLLTQ